jgi:hypothetical protein
MLFHIYHQHPGDETMERNSQAWTVLENNEVEAYTRRKKASELLEPIDCGWIEDDQVGLVLIENLAGKGKSVSPTDEEKKLVESSVLELVPSGFDSQSCGIRILPGFPFVFFPENINSWMIRSINGESFNYRLTIFPK